MEENGGKDFSEIKDCLMKLEIVKAIISPLKDTGFPEKRFAVADQVSKNEVTGKKEKKTVEVPLMVKIVVYKDGPEVRDQIDGIIGDIPYKITILPARS